MIDECYEAGMKHFANKPISMHEVRNIIAKYHFKLTDEHF